MENNFEAIYMTEFNFSALYTVYFKQIRLFNLTS